MILAVAFTVAGIAATALIFLKSHGAGISVGLLVALVTIGFLYDNRHRGESVTEMDEDFGAGSMAVQRKAAVRQARSMALREDRNFPGTKH